MGLDWLLKNKPKNENNIPKIRNIETRMKELKELGLKSLEVGREYETLQKELSKFEITPEESIGMKTLGEAEPEIQKFAFEKYAMISIEKARKGIGSEMYIRRWKDMTFEKWIKENANDLLIESVPEKIRKNACIGGSHQGNFGPFSFRGNVLKNSKILPEEQTWEAFSDMTCDMMLSYAGRLELYKKKWEMNNVELMKHIKTFRTEIERFEADYHWTIVNSMDDLEYQEYDQKMIKNYDQDFIKFIGSLCETTFGDYRALEDAIKWLRFWAKTGHSMYASW